MPIYEYECESHGLFEEERPMQRSREDASCPRCRVSSRRILSSTHTALLPRARSAALARNEKSRHSPEVCSHRPGHGKSPAPPRPGAARVYRGQRPWVIEHG